MIISKIVGGLGNQFFQYAAGKSLSSKWQTELKLDISSFSQYKLHKYSLNHFNIHASSVSSEELRVYESNRKGIFGFFQTKKEVKKLNKYSENNFQYNKEFERLPGNTYIIGYWQSEKYFKDIEAQLRSELTVKTEPAGKNKYYLNLTQSENSIAIHIRRKDYVKNTVHELCSMDYYREANNYIKKYIKKPIYFIFSDEPDWVKQNFYLNGQTYYVDHNGPERNFEDLRIMQMCKHIIIANSTFSWWGAWLNKNPKKIVTAPKKWFKDTTLKTDDLIPKAWIRI